MIQAGGQDGYVIRRMERQEVDFAVGMAALEGWNPGLADAECFWRADPRGFFVGELEGRPVATISVVSYGGEPDRADLGFVGLYIVVPEERGKGYGARLWNAALAEVPAKCLGLDSVVDQLDTYRKDGFELDMHSVRYEGMSGGSVPPGVAPLAHEDFEAVRALDRCCFPAPRDAFLRGWLSAPGHVCLGLKRDGVLAGYGVVRPCGVGSKIGPLFAQDDAAGHALFHGLCASARHGAVYLDVPMPHRGAVELAESHGMRPVFETGRMYKGPAPEFDLGRVFGITSFELG